MLIAENIEVSTLSRESLTVTWQIRETSKDLSQYKLQVLRSESESGPYEVASPDINPADLYSFEDSRVNLLSFIREYYYRLRVTEAGSGASWEWGSTPPEEVLKGRDPGGAVMETPPDLEAAEAIRRFDLNLREYIGNRVFFFKRRRSGQRCQRCWDSLAGRKKISRCQTCFDTTWTGGFFYPRETWIMNASGDPSQAMTPVMKIEPGDRVVWANARPRMLPEDVIVDLDGTRWQVLPVDRAGKLGTTTRQSVRLRPITREQVEYDIPLRGLDLVTLNQAPHRQYLRSMDIDEYYTEAGRRGVSDEVPNQIRGFRMDIDEERS